MCSNLITVLGFKCMFMLSLGRNMHVILHWISAGHFLVAVKEGVSKKIDIDFNDRGKKNNYTDFSGGGLGERG